MTYYIIIRGPLGVGKSTVARKLADKLHAKYISIDKVLENHNLDKVEGKAIPVENFLKANELVFPMVKETISRGIPVVFDGNFYYKRQLGDLEYLMETIQTGINRYAFDLKASLKTCIKRDRKRHGSYGPDATEAVYKAVSKFKYGTPINTQRRSADAVVREIMENIEKKKPYHMLNNQKSKHN